MRSAARSIETRSDTAFEKYIFVQRFGAGTYWISLFSRYKSTLHLVEDHRHRLYIESEKQINLIPVSRHCWFQYGSLSVISINSMVLNSQVAAADKMSVNDMMIEQVFSKSVLASRMQSTCRLVAGKHAH